MKKTKIKRKLTALLLTLAMSSTLLVGCGSSKESKTTEEQTTQATETTEAASDTDTTEAAATEAVETYEPATIRIGVSSGRTAHFTASVAQQEGIYDKYNLNVEVIEFSAGIDTINAIELGQVDVGFVADFAGLNRIGNLSDPAASNLRFIARLERTATTALYVNPDTVSSLEDLKGKKIAIQLGTIREYFNINALTEAGLTVDDVEIVPVDSIQTGLALAESRDVDAVWIEYGQVSKATEYGFTELITQEQLGIYQNSIYVTTDEYIASDSDVLIRFLKATAESYAFIENNFDKATEDINKVTGMDITLVADTLAGTSLLLDFPQDLLNDLSAMDQWLLDNEYYENSIDLEKFIYTDVLKEALPEADVY